MSSSSIVAIKLLLISSGVVLLGMSMKLTIIPWFINFSVSELPIIWYFMVSLCKPPYLYVLINGIIITIAASSRFTRTETEVPSSNLDQFQPLISAKTPPLIQIQHAVDEVVMLHDQNVLNINVKEPVVEKAEPVVVAEEEEEVVEPASNKQPQEPELVFPVRGKGNLRTFSRFAPPKPSNPTPQVVRGVKEEEVTLESMWKTIMEGRQEPLEQFINKSEDYTQTVDDESKPKKTTFKDRESPLKSWILKKEPTLSQDELNRRAEEFIHKFNEEMRMQRQQSLNQNINIIAPHQPYSSNWE